MLHSRRGSSISCEALHYPIWHFQVKVLGIIVFTFTELAPRLIQSLSRNVRVCDTHMWMCLFVCLLILASRGFNISAFLNIALKVSIVRQVTCDRWHSEHCSHHSTHCTHHYAHYTHNSALCTIKTKRCLLHTTHCTLHTAHCTLHMCTTRWMLNTEYYTLHTTHCILHTRGVKHITFTDHRF